MSEDVINDAAERFVQLILEASTKLTGDDFVDHIRETYEGIVQKVHDNDDAQYPEETMDLLKAALERSDIGRILVAIQVTY